jgi:phospholipid/cholesterol/gamma-HCH transport system permease protein
MATRQVPIIEVVALAAGHQEVRLSGHWTLARLASQMDFLAAKLAAAAQQPAASWNCLALERLDSAGAMLLWRAWGSRLPQQLQATAEQLRIFERVAAVGHVPRRVRAPLSPLSWVMQIGRILLTFVDHARSFVLMMGQLLLDFLHLLRHPKDWPRLEISANLYKSGVSAMPVTAIVGFLIGVVMSYLSSLQLKQFGGDVFIVNILGMSIIRELGPVLVAVLVAGRSGSAMTAQLGVMRVTEEIDALATMGVSQSLRLIFPKVLALAIALPLLTLWISGVALLGGMIAAEVQLDISFGYFFENLPKVVPIANLWIGLTKGFVFGIAVALVACHFGLRIKPNTESLSVNTTASVVSSITLVILIDAIVAIITRDIGLF